MNWSTVIIALVVLYIVWRVRKEMKNRQEEIRRSPY